MNQIVLLGDSILDNRSYTAPEPDSAFHLQRLLGAKWTVSLLAQDGAVMQDLASQVARLPGNTDIAVVSIGGNDATRHLHLLEPQASSTVEVIGQLAQVAGEFAQAYAECIAPLKRLVGRLVVCTIYEVPLDHPRRAELVRVPLAVLNDRIIRVAARAGAEILDLRFVCDQPSDYVLQIEPSATGALKIAEAIAAVAQDTAGSAATRYHRGL